MQRDTRDVHTPRRDHVRIKWKGGHLQATEGDLEEIKPTDSLTSDP